MEEAKTKQGWIYILVNPSMNGKVKIGKTQRTPEERAKELHTSGVPEPFIVFYKRFFEDCHQAEKDIHAFLERDRIKDNDREFFTTEPHLAVQIVDRFYYEEKFKKYDKIIEEQNNAIINLKNSSEVLEGEVEFLTSENDKRQDAFFFWVKNLVIKDAISKVTLQKPSLGYYSISKTVESLYEKLQLELTGNTTISFDFKVDKIEFLDEVTIELFVNSLVSPSFNCLKVEKRTEEINHLFGKDTITYFRILITKS